MPPPAPARVRGGARPFPALALLALAVLPALAPLLGCQVGGGSASGPPFAALREELRQAHERLQTAASQGEVERVPDLDRALGRELDRIESRSAALDLLQRESLAIQIASARRCLTAVDRYAASGDVELVTAQLRQLDPTLREVDTILERAVRVETAKP